MRVSYLRGAQYYSEILAYDHVTKKVLKRWSMSTVTETDPTLAAKHAQRIVVYLEDRKAHGLQVVRPWMDETGTELFDIPKPKAVEPPPPPPKPTVKDLVEYYRRTMVANMLKSRTTYNSLCNSVNKLWGTIPYDALRKEDIKAVVTAAKKKLAGTEDADRGDAHLGSIIQVLLSAYREASCPESGLNITRTYICDLKRKKLDVKGGRTRDVLVSAEMFERFYAWFTEHDKNLSMLYLALWETSRRPNEVGQYTWEMFKPEKRVINGVVRHYYAFIVPKHITKKDQDDIVEISDRLYEAIRYSIPREGLVFKASDTRAWKDNCRRIRYNKLRKAFPNSWNASYRDSEKENGAGGTVIRDCRRGRITQQLDAGVDRDDVKACSGHKTESAFNRYDKTDIVLKKLKATHPDWFTVEKPDDKEDSGTGAVQAG